LNARLKLRAVSPNRLSDAQVKSGRKLVTIKDVVSVLSRTIVKLNGLAVSPFEPGELLAKSDRGHIGGNLVRWAARPQPIYRRRRGATGKIVALDS